MKELVEHIVKAIVNNPEEVVVVKRESVDFPGLQLIKITVHPDDLGRVIGKRGRTINAIRDLVTIAAIKNQERVKVIIDEEKSEAMVEDEPQSEEKTEETPEEETQETEDLGDFDDSDILS
jgi:hypothetical protein